MEITKCLKNKTILLVEDEDIIRNNIASMLKHFFKEVYTATDGYDGLDQYEQHLPNIVMTDLKMPYMTGLELIKELQKKDSRAFTIVVSAHTDTELLIESIHNGVNRYIVKPLTEDKLFDTFKAYLKNLDEHTPEIINIDEYIICNFQTNEIIRNGTENFSLNKKEVLLLKLLVSNKEKIFSYEEIENHVWGSDSMSISAIRSVVRDLRKKLSNKHIKNISGIGYKLVK